MIISNTVATLFWLDEATLTLKGVSGDFRALGKPTSFLLFPHIFINLFLVPVVKMNKQSRGKTCHVLTP